jgi:hypothetical protein
MKLSLLLLLALAPLARAEEYLSKTPRPEDLGPAIIDVSSYPEEYQKTYREVFVPYFTTHGGLPRAINSPIIELDAHLEEQVRRESPQLFSDPQVAQVSRDGWKTLVRKLYLTPACCGACRLLTLEQARSLWRFLVYDSIQRKTGRKAGLWALERKDLVMTFSERKSAAQETGK